MIYSDLDGTFLDSDSYSCEESLPVLKKAIEMGITVIFCSSKTRAEIDALLSALDLSLPFISENGGGIFIPNGRSSTNLNGSSLSGAISSIALGKPYSELTKALIEVSNEIGVELRGFSNMSLEEVSSLCGFGIEESKLAKMRDFDEPFVFESKDHNLLKKISAAFAARGMRVTRGGRFHHLTGINDKGAASRLLAQLFGNEFGKVETVGIGDSENDLPMLKAVDRPVLVQKPDGSYDKTILKSLPKAELADGIGPRGWAKAISKLISNG